MSDQQRVVHMVPAIFGKGGIVGGAERYAYELARTMAAKTPTRLLTFGEESRTFSDGDLLVRVLGNPWRVRGQRNNCLHSGMLLELAKADVIHCHQHHLLASSVAAIISMCVRNKCFVSDLGGAAGIFPATFRLMDGSVGICTLANTAERYLGMIIAPTLVLSLAVLIRKNSHPTHR